MKIQQQLFALLSPVVGAVNATVWPIAAEQGAALPHVTYQVIYSPNENVLSGAPPPIQQTRMQIDCWAQDYLGALALADLVTTTMQGWSVQNVQLGSQDFFEFEVRIYRVMLDYSIWYH